MATLLELKKRKMELRDKMDEERKDGSGVSEETGLEYGQLIDRLQGGEHKLLKRLVWPTLLCLLLIIIGGCSLGVGMGADASLYYPNIPGKFEDPAPSRGQSTQHTTGMARNNLPMIGGD